MLRNHTKRKFFQTGVCLGLISFFIHYSQAQVNINSTNSPDPSAALQITSGLAGAQKGFLPPKVALISSTDAITILNPAHGLIVYNTASTIDGDGLYLNKGTSAVPEWVSLQIKSSSQGSSLVKQMYVATSPDPTKTLKIGNLIFRLNGTTVGGTGASTVREVVALANAPAATVTIRNAGSSFYPTAQYNYLTNVLTFTTANYATYQNLPLLSLENNEYHVYNIFDVANNKYYRANFYVSGPSGGPYLFAMTAESF